MICGWYVLLRQGSALEFRLSGVGALKEGHIQLHVRWR